MLRDFCLQMSAQIEQTNNDCYCLEGSSQVWRFFEEKIDNADIDGATATTSFCRPAGHVICGSDTKANTRVTVGAKGPIQQLACCVWCFRPPNGQRQLYQMIPLAL